MEKDYAIARMEDAFKGCLKSKRLQYTDFLTLSEQKQFEKLALKYKNEGLKYFLEGGYPSAERKIGAVYPDFLEFQKEELPLKALRIEGRSNFSHRDVLGSILGLGVKRGKIGDIIVNESKCDVILKEEMRDFLLFNLTKIGRESVEVHEIELSDVMQPEIKYKDIFSTVASLRVDSVAASGFGISRTKASELIKSGLLQVNWEAVEDPSFHVGEGDVISLRGFGRIKLQEIKGNTKKGRISIHILRYL
ncbi:RNA-binding protein [Caldanaerobacter subterraneus]|uniref:RNA-binding protein YlmH n=1 Tax=Caldanaerobacter subterraneus TaxID=911092 RepID=A0A4R2JQL2_9THEO|nr:YlmH/Sll1252 family protein [Caldanaerobacter subterraneus]TCO61327.1 RNA-binding protein YlmH [Caldanaerobacter subterraneus]